MNAAVTLVTGATGYVGGHLLNALIASRRPIRCLVRRPQALAGRMPAGDVICGDVFDTTALDAACIGVDTAYYLIHSMSSPGAFEETDRKAAGAFAAAAHRHGLHRIIYLGGLASGHQISAHLTSRHEVGDILRTAGVPTVEFRASVIIGPGSLSFEIVRGLVDRLPVMVTPRWVHTKAQPIAIADVVAYLLAALDMDIYESTVFEIGGPEQLSYLDLMQEYAHQRHLRRLIIPVPVLSPWLSSLWLSLITPIYARVGRKLIEGVRSESIVTDDRALHVFAIRPRSVQQAITEALVDAEARL